MAPRRLWAGSFLCLILGLTLLPWSAKATPLRRNDDYSRGGVKLSRRPNVKETCPLLTYCQCKVRGFGLDITCDKINSYKLKVRNQKNGGIISYWSLFKEGAFLLECFSQLELLF